MNAGDDLADASLDAGLFPEFCDVFSGLANDDTGILGAHESAEGQGVGADGGRATGLGGGAWKEINQTGRRDRGRRTRAHQCRGQRGRRRA